MQTKTWPYGTVKQVKVVERRSAKFKGQAVEVVLCVEPASNEGFVLMDRGVLAQVGEEGFITFTNGGPTGGYWKYSKERPACS
jgi:hypothetical protein